LAKLWLNVIQFTYLCQCFTSAILKKRVSTPHSTAYSEAQRNEMANCSGDGSIKHNAAINYVHIDIATEQY
jgi:hypothetical protein